MGFVQGVHRNQGVMFPESLDEYIVDDNPVRFIDAFVDNLDLQVKYRAWQREDDVLPLALAVNHHRTAGTQVALARIVGAKLGQMQRCVIPVLDTKKQHMAV